MAFTISTSQFVSRAEEYFRAVGRTGEEIVVTDGGDPIARIIPYVESPVDALKTLRSSVGRPSPRTTPESSTEWESRR
ncbi:type II toxin-antitoxin system Phd/YefM family antitoxin [Planctomycetota bacterium]